MANKVTGNTDTSGALSVLPRQLKCAIIVAEKKVDTDETVDTVAESIFDITGTVDAKLKFGSLSPAIDLTKILISNGVSFIKGMMIGTYGTSQTYTSKSEAYAAAFAKTLYDNSIMMIVLDTTDSSVISVLKTHLDTAESEDMFRYSVVGAAVGQTNTQLGTLASGINSSRIFIVGPNVVDMSNTALSGMYGAAGVAGAIMTETGDPSLPMNNVTLKGFGGVERVLLRSDKETLGEAGVVALFASQSGEPTIHRLVTTYTEDDKIWQEGTTRFIADDVMASVQQRLRANYPRTKNVARILASIKTDVIDVLTTKNGLEIIQNFDPSTVSVIKDPSDIYGAIVDYEFQVVTPLYTITINQHMKL